jgi:hypothetical protein
MTVAKRTIEIDAATAAALETRAAETGLSISEPRADMVDPFAAFDEWSGQADEKAYRSL